jgi:hypothetical protein
MRVRTSVVDFTDRNLASGRLNPSSLQLRISNVRLVKEINYLQKSKIKRQEIKQEINFSACL